MKTIVPALLAALLAAAPACAGELFAGVLAHEAFSFTEETREGGADLQAGYRFGPILRAAPGLRPYAFGSVNTNGDTSFIAAGLGWKFGSRVYVRPGIGIAVHDGPENRCCFRGQRTDLGSRVLFEPEIALGVRLAPRITAEATYAHLSHARLFSRQNPGLDLIGVRVNVALR